ncbi:MAG: AIR carboxylase family protein [Dermatophilaceae bacterium]
MSSGSPQVGIVMGSRSDLETMSQATETLAELGITYELRVVSAHRTPDDMITYARSATGRGLRVIIAGAGGAAHLLEAGVEINVIRGWLGHADLTTTHIHAGRPDIPGARPQVRESSSPRVISSWVDSAVVNNTRPGPDRSHCIADRVRAHRLMIALSTFEHLGRD